MHIGVQWRVATIKDQVLGNINVYKGGLNENLSTFSDQINSYIISLYINKLKEFKSLNLKYGYVFLPQNSTWMHQMLNVQADVFNFMPSFDSIHLMVIAIVKPFNFLERWALQ